MIFIYSSGHDYSILDKTVMYTQIIQIDGESSWMIRAEG